MPDWRMKGHYIKNCNCLASCPCDTIGFPKPDPHCEGLVGMDVAEGHFEDTDLGGAKWVIVFHWPGALHEGNGTLDVFIDESTSDDQREALGQIFSGEVGGPWFEVVSSIVTTVHGPHFVPIAFEFDRESRRAHVKIEGVAETTSEPLIIPATDDEQRVVVQMPNGMEYKEMEVAQTGTLKSSGEIKFEHKGTHSSLADVEHTPEGLAA